MAAAAVYQQQHQLYALCAITYIHACAMNP